MRQSRWLSASFSFLECTRVSDGLVVEGLLSENVTVDVVSAGFTNKYHPHSHRVLGEICSGERGFDWKRFKEIFYVDTFCVGKSL